MRHGDLPPSTELAAHVDTALDAASRWISRGLKTRVSDGDGWENAVYFSRVLLTRAADSIAQLGYVLQRDALQGQAEESRKRVRQASAYRREASDDLDNARQALKEIGTAGPDDLQARRSLSEANGLVQASHGWVEQLAATLNEGRGPDRSPSGPSLARIPEQSRADDHWDRGIA